MSKEKAAAGEKLLPKLALVGKTMGAIYGTMAALTAVGWVITRANEKKKEHRQEPK